MEREPWIECVDESIRDDVITVGGFIARTEDLADIETRWRETKRTFRLPLDAELKFSLPKGHPSRAVLDAHGLGQQTRIPIMLKAISEMSLHVIANTLIDHRPETAPLELPVYGLRLHIRHFEGVAVDPVVPTKGPEESTAMNPSQIIFHRRVRVLEHAAKTSVAEAHRVFGVSRKTIHDWKRVAAAYGLHALMPKARRAPAMPNATPTWVVEELLA